MGMSLRAGTGCAWRGAREAERKDDYKKEPGRAAGDRVMFAIPSFYCFGVLPGGFEDVLNVTRLGTV